MQISIGMPLGSPTVTAGGGASLVAETWAEYGDDKPIFYPSFVLAQQADATFNAEPIVGVTEAGDGIVVTGSTLGLSDGGTDFVAIYAGFTEDIYNFGNTYPNGRINNAYDADSLNVYGNYDGTQFQTNGNQLVIDYTCDNAIFANIIVSTAANGNPIRYNGITINGSTTTVNNEPLSSVSLAKTSGTHQVRIDLLPLSSMALNGIIAKLEFANFSGTTNMSVDRIAIVRTGTE